MRRLRSISAILIALAFVMAACGATQPSASEGAGASTPAEESSAPAPSQGGDATGGTVRIGIGGSADSLNPGNGVLSEA